MNPRQREHFARRLEEERASLTSAVRSLEQEAEQDVIEAAPERRRMRDALSDAEVAEAATSVEVERLREIDVALQRLREAPEDFGRCIVCHAPIQLRRLEIVPWTQRCTKHAAERARAEREEIQARTS